MAQLKYEPAFRDVVLSALLTNLARISVYSVKNGTLLLRFTNLTTSIVSNAVSLTAASTPAAASGTPTYIELETAQGVALLSDASDDNDFFLVLQNALGQSVATITQNESYQIISGTIGVPA